MPYVSKILDSATAINEIAEFIYNKAMIIHYINGPTSLYFDLLELSSDLKNKATLIREGFNEISEEYTKAVNQHSASILSLALHLDNEKKDN